MLTISQLAAYAGVTVRAVRHYHQIGLMPEPERDASGYRSYDADDVVGLIRIRTLAEAGVPLARVQELLAATSGEFDAAVAQIDAELRAEIRRLRHNRTRIARLAAGDSLALPQVVVDFLDQLRAVGAPEQAVVTERDAWILMAARYPDHIEAFMADKRKQLEDGRFVRFYRLMGAIVAGDVGEDRLTEAADLLAEMANDAADRGEIDAFDAGIADQLYVSLMDTFAKEAHPMVERLQQLMEERGWTGWTHMERTADPH